MDDRLALFLLAVTTLLAGIGLVQTRSNRDRQGPAFAAFGLAALTLGLLLGTLWFIKADYSWVAAVFADVSLILLALFAGGTWAWQDLKGLSRVAGFVGVLASCAALAVLPFQPRILRLALDASRPAVDRLAERVRSGEAVDVPVRAGLFVVRKLRVESEPGAGSAVGLVIHHRYGGDSALVHFPAGNRGRADETGDERLAFYGPLVNLNFDLPLAGGWRYQFED